MKISRPLTTLVGFFAIVAVTCFLAATIKWTAPETPDPMAYMVVNRC